jgi:glucose uptake protein GlcU
LNNKFTIIVVTGFIMLFASSLLTVYAQQTTAPQTQNHPGNSMIEGIISLVSSTMAIFLFIISVNAYRVEKRRRFLFVSAAFLLFAVKGIMFATSEMFLPTESAVLEMVSVLLDFGILTSFFAGLFKK